LHLKGSKVHFFGVFIAPKVSKWGFSPTYASVWIPAPPTRKEYPGNDDNDPKNDKH